ncbi:MAG TPA: N-acetyltransferase [Nitrospinota bacterium]|jgi:amino-acid N-acetyltransferase|nr:N-acetyltransferase [Nitrospinota bacterium]
MKQNVMIRKATLNDIPSIQETIKPYAVRGEMLPRTLNDLYEHIRDFSVYEKGNRVLGVAALAISWENIAEIRSLAILENSLSIGIGSALVKYCLEEARSLNVKKVFVLTYTSEFFKKIGFHPIDKEDLPQKIWKDCVNCSKFPACDEQALIMEL